MQNETIYTYTNHRLPRPYQLNPGDVMFVSDQHMKELGMTKYFMCDKVVLAGRVVGIITKVCWSEKKWWQFWKKKVCLGCNVEIL